MSPLILNPFHWLSLQFCPIGVSSYSTYQILAFFFKSAQSTRTNYTQGLLDNLWLHLWGQRCYRLPSVALVPSFSSPIQIRIHATFKVCRRVSLLSRVSPPIHILHHHPRPFEKFLKGCLRYSPYRGYEDWIKRRTLKVKELYDDLGQTCSTHSWEATSCPKQDVIVVPVGVF
jgi:hypothetical protein